MSRRWKFFRENGELRARLVNPPLIIANGKKRKKNMAKTITMRRNKKGQFVAVSRSTNPRPHHHRAKRKNAPHRRRRNYMGAGATMIPMNPRKRRRNPPTEVLGVPLPNMQDTIEITLGVSAGYAGPTIVLGFMNQLLPATITTSLGTMGPTILKLLSYAIPPFIANAVSGRQAMKYVIAGELATIVVGLLTSVTSTLTASLAPSTAAGYTNVRRAPVIASGNVRTLGRVRNVAGYVAHPQNVPAQLRSFGTGFRSMPRQSRFQSPRR
jgi:hypothetical protein